MTTVVLRLRKMLAAALAVAVALGAGAASASSFYTGAYAMVGESGCTGGDGMGSGPGCTPGVDGLTHSQAFVNGNRGPANYSEGIADLPSATLVAKSIFPDGSANAPNGGANLTDTFTVIGALPTDMTITVSMIIDSTITGGANTDLGFGNLNADLTTANWEGTFHATYVRDATANGPDHYVLTRTVTVNDANRVFRVDATLMVSGGGIPGSHSSDASAQIELSLPDGVGYTSASGVFATVPEPSETALLSAGFACLATWRRRTRDRR